MNNELDFDLESDCCSLHAVFIHAFMYMSILCGTRSW